MTAQTNRFTAPFALARYRDGDAVQLGLVAGERIRPLGPSDLGAPDLNTFLGAPDWNRLAALAAAEGDEWMPVGEVVLTAPVEPRQVLQAGANYREHVIQLVAAGLTQDGSRTPEEAREFAAEMMDKRAAHGDPYFFIGLPACVVGDDEPLVLPAYSEVHDWELELAVVIGSRAFHVSRAEALQHVAGYTIVNDVTTRDLVFRKDMKEIGTDWYRAKNAPGFLPTGPFLVPAQFVDTSDTNLRLDLNGETKQDGSTSDLLFDVAALVSGASQTMPLLPGDLLLTGSPAGNGQHWKRFLRDGDVMTGSIEGLGTQVVRCVAEGDAS
ncbi:fumarylacetoacetate hydrolase family protein [Subtercola frigoramans]|uniref:2-keto-4-pentenoate hydratase/2-oxohepta-3-ene-1,7-dioic acid hydratase in catechol pathway n=1 Tax=Subtercola frigoramans TaxID=120298 RepID=A0ABS2L966_9MICO|nr:fumarylacetoacetate hydrolase family protein [Subtercola frigoramans]MBM7473617.1 2-keto-4-pentenoate hydratase/2-oxohepta-3-ene-1,7-dioic acid hydratase in catechol pathway [Subtercola frigoramans]